MSVTDQASHCQEPGGVKEETGGDGPGSLILFLDLSGNPTHCGYCGGQGSVSQGMWAEKLTVRDYQDLLDRGWRRSGRYVYRPNMSVTCCPLYTIRCLADKFQPTKSQRKVVKKVQNFVKNGRKPVEDDPQSNCKEEVADEGKKDEQPSVESRQLKRVEGLKKAKIIRRGKYLEKLVKAGIEPSKEDESKKKGISDLLPNLNHFALNTKIGQSVAESAHEFELRLVKADLGDRRFMSSFHESYRVYRKYQTLIHKDKPQDCDIQTFAGFLCDSPLVYEQRGDAMMGAFHQQYLIDGAIVCVGVVDILPHSLSSVYLYYDPAWWGQGSNLSPGTYTAIREIQFTQQLGLPYYYMGYYIHSCPKMRYKGRFLPAHLLSPTTMAWHSIEKCLPQLEESKYSTFYGIPAVEDQAVMPELDVGNVKMCVNNILTTYSKWRITGGHCEEVEKYHALVGQSLAERLVLKWGGNGDDDDDDIGSEN